MNHAVQRWLLRVTQSASSSCFACTVPSVDESDVPGFLHSGEGGLRPGACSRSSPERTPHQISHVINIEEYTAALNNDGGCYFLEMTVEDTLESISEKEPHSPMINKQPCSLYDYDKISQKRGKKPATYEHSLGLMYVPILRLPTVAHICNMAPVQVYGTLLYRHMPQ